MKDQQWNRKPVVMIIVAILLLAAITMAVVFSIGIKPRPSHPITYSRDGKTGLCFAHGGTGGLFGGHTLTNVPCTEAVLRQIPAAKR